MSIKENFQKNWDESVWYVKASRIILAAIALPLMFFKFIFEALARVFEILLAGIINVCGGRWGE